MKHKAGEHEH